MATTALVDASAYSAIVAGPIDVYFNNHGPYEVLYRVATTGAQTLTAEGIKIEGGQLHPVRIPDGSSLYARLRELSSSKSVRVGYTEAFLGPEA